MSTKCTIDHAPDNYHKKPQPLGVDYHLFHECFDDDNVYLELKGESFTFLEVSKDRVTIAIPGRLYNHLVRNGELKSWGGENFDQPKTQEERNKELQEDMENTIEMLKGMKNREARKERTQNKIDAIFGKDREKEDGEA